MTSPAHQLQKFAPPVSSPGACAIGGRRCSLLASAATINNPERHSKPAGGQAKSHGRMRLDGVKLGLRGGFDRSFIHRAIRPTRLFQHQTDSHSRAGQSRWGRCDYRPAVDRTGGLCARLGHYTDSTCRGINGSGPFRQFAGIGAAATVPVANLIHNRRERAFQALRAALRSMVGLGHSARTRDGGSE